MNDQTAAGSGSAATPKVDFQKIFKEVKEVAVNPVGCWNNIRGTYNSVKDFYMNFLGPLLLIPPVAAFIGLSIIGIPNPITGGTFRTPFVSGLVSVVLQFGLALAMAYLSALILSKLAPKFGGSEDLLAALKLVGYAWAPYYLASILTILPVIGLLVVLVGLYGIYIFYQGISPMLSVPATQRVVYTVVSVVVIFVARLLVGGIAAIVVAGASAGPM